MIVDRGENVDVIFVARDFQGYQGVQKSSATAFLGLCKGVLRMVFPVWPLSKSAFLVKKWIAQNMQYLPDASIESNSWTCCGKLLERAFRSAYNFPEFSTFT